MEVRKRVNLPSIQENEVADGSNNSLSPKPTCSKSFTRSNSMPANPTNFSKDSKPENLKLDRLTIVDQEIKKYKNMSYLDWVRRKAIRLLLKLPILNKNLTKNSHSLTIASQSLTFSCFLSIFWLLGKKDCSILWVFILTGCLCYCEIKRNNRKLNLLKHQFDHKTMQDQMTLSARTEMIKRQMTRSHSMAVSPTVSGADHAEQPRTKLLEQEIGTTLEDFVLASKLSNPFVANTNLRDLENDSDGETGQQLLNESNEFEAQLLRG